MKVIVKDVLGKNRGLSADDAECLFDAIYRIHPDNLFLSFEGMKSIGNLFLMWSIGRYVYSYNYVSNGKRLGFKGLNYYTQNSLHRLHIEDCIENALMGEEYDKLVENAENVC